MDILLHPTLDDLPRLGGKAANLVRLQSLDLRVPPFVVIPQDALSGGLPTHPSATDAADCISLILQYFSSIAPSTTPLFAVRSSALVEDGATHSFAGQFESVIGVGAEALPEAIERVRQSGQGERVRAYCRASGLPEPTGLAIIVQQLVQPEVSGVAFGRHPLSGRADAVVINAIYGLGEGLVSGDLEADTFVVMPGEKVEATLVTKPRGLFYDVENQKVLFKEIPLAQQTTPTLTDAQALEIATVLRRLEMELGAPQDIEFAYADGLLYLLQTRPITGQRANGKRQIATEQLTPAPHSLKKCVWDNSNIIESYPGVTSPLTFSFIRAMYEAVYRQMADIMGVPAAAVERNAGVFANLLGLLRGRVYYHLENWYRALALLPGYRVNARFMETMMGVKERFDLPPEEALPTTPAARFGAWLRLLWAVLRMLGLAVNLPRARRRFKTAVDAILADYQRLDFEAMPPEAAMQRYLFFEKFLLKKWRAPLVNDFFAMIWFGLLQKQCAHLCPNQPGLSNDLLAGSHDIISTEPVRRIQALAAAVQADPAAQAFFAEHPAPAVWQALPRFPRIQALFQEYLRDFGERTVGELKLETIPYSREPARFVAIVQAHSTAIIAHEKASKPAFDATAIRRQAEVLIATRLKGKFGQKMLFKLILRQARDLVSNRENLRYERTRAFGMVRRIFAGIGRQFFVQGILDDPRDIFYLGKDEVFAFLQGTALSVRLRETAAARRAEFAAFAAEMPLPERIVTFGSPYHGNALSSDELRNNGYSSDALKSSDEVRLRGIGCSAGIVRGRVRVVHRPDEVASLDGDILVTAATDPGWVVLFPSAAAILVERGSLLSHSAIVSRELGIPCIVGLSGLLARLKTGDWVEMDGTTGEVILGKNTNLVAHER